MQVIAFAYVIKTLLTLHPVRLYYLYGVHKTDCTIRESTFVALLRWSLPILCAAIIILICRDDYQLQEDPESAGLSPMFHYRQDRGPLEKTL